MDQKKALTQKAAVLTALWDIQKALFTLTVNDCMQMRCLDFTDAIPSSLYMVPEINEFENRIESCIAEFTVQA